MSKCRSCQAHTNLYLCGHCTTNLREYLQSLTTRWADENHPQPGLLQHLHETATGQTRHGNPTRHTTYRHHAEINGENPPAHYIEQLPNNITNLEKARQKRQQTALNHALTLGHINKKAADLHTEITYTLTTWASALARTHGHIITPNPTQLTPTPQDLAQWLANNTHLIAKDEDAADFYHTIQTQIRRIENTINRPPPPRILGPCPTPLETSHDKQCQQRHPHPCGIRLSAPQGAKDVTCTRCKTTHNIEQLAQQQKADLDERSFTIDELIDTVFPQTAEHIPYRTLQHWISTGRLISTCPDTDGQPRYLLADIRQLAAAKPQKTVTGAAAHKKRHTTT